MKRNIKNILVIICLVCFVGCSKDDKPYYPTHEELIGKRFGRTSTYFEVISADSILWMVDPYRDEPITYRTTYELTGDKISFEVADTTRVDYENTSFTITYYFDSFEGTFNDANTITATMKHSYEVRVDDLFSNSFGSLETTFEFYYMPNSSK